MSAEVIKATTLGLPKTAHKQSVSTTTVGNGIAKRVRLFIDDYNSPYVSARIILDEVKKDSWTVYNSYFKGTGKGVEVYGKNLTRKEAKKLALNILEKTVAVGPGGNLVLAGTDYEEYVDTYSLSLGVQK